MNAAFEVAKTQVKALPKDHVDFGVLQKFGVALAKIGEGLAQQAQTHPDRASVDRLEAVVEMLETNIPEEIGRKKCSMRSKESQA